MLARVRVLSVAVMLMACRPPADEPPRTTPGAPIATTTTNAIAVGRPDPIEHDARHTAIEIPTQPAPRVSSTLYTPPSTLGEPIAIYRAVQSRPVFLEPNTAATLRGRIEMRESFHVYAVREGEDHDGCSKPWVQVGDAAWVCSKHIEVDADAKPHTLPRIPKNKLLPFVYARHRRHQDPATPKLPVHRHLTALRSGAEPVDWLAAHGTYAFVRRARTGPDAVLVDARGRVVPAVDMRIFEPSGFAGRDLVAAPVPDDVQLAWVIHRETGIHAKPDPESERKPLDYQAELLVQGQPAMDEQDWIGVEDGWIPAAHVRLWRPLAPPEPVLTGQLLIDVDLEQQTLTLWHEDQAIFATLISSGKPGYSTPLGLYRIITKRAHGKMASLPTEPAPYWVDAVPWTMYFDGRFALHGAFWHDRFGYRVSHGCINLSPRDARFLFDRSTPNLPPGWLLVNEHAGDPGTLVRIHKGDPDVPDRRSAKLEGAVLAD